MGRKKKQNRFDPVVKEWGDSRLWGEYKEWLFNECKINPVGYDKLFDHLHNREFIVLVSRDNNRAGDGTYLRGYYFLDNNMNGFDFDRPATVLEVLVALACRYDNEYGSPKVTRPDIIFWEMFGNLGLNQYDDRNYSRDGVDDILDRWMNRVYDQNGNGSIFPMKHTERDQRDLEIWSQLNEYVTEKIKAGTYLREPGYS